MNEFENLLDKGYQVTIKDYVRSGLNIFSANAFFYITYSAIAMAILLLISTMPSVRIYGDILVRAPLEAGIFIVAIKHIRGEAYDFGDLFTGFNFYFTLILFTVAAWALIVAGFLALVLPAVYLAVSYLFVVPLIVDRGLTFWKAMELSRRVVSREWLKIFLLALLVLAIYSAGLLALVIGILVTGPLSACIVAAAYADIFGIAKESSAPAYTLE